MITIKNGLLCLFAAGSLIQICPAPVPVVAAIAGGITSGSIIGGANLCAKYCPDKKDLMQKNVLRALPPGVSQWAVDQCTSQINDQKKQGVTVGITSVNEGTVNVTNLPPACMNLATVLTGNPAQMGGPIPIPTSSNSLQFSGLTTEDRQNLDQALGF